MRTRLTHRLPALAALCTLVGLIGVVSPAAAQDDVAWSLAEFMPTRLNPALTGAYLGTARVGGIYRDQWRGFNIEPFQTPGFFIDAPIITLGKKKRAWLGIGGTLVSDQRGIAELATTYAQLSGAVHFILEERRQQRTVFSVGLIGGVMNRGLDLSSDRILLEDEIGSDGTGGLGLLASPDRQLMTSASGIDVGLGVSYARKLSDEQNFRVGLTALQLTVPDLSVAPGEDYRQEISINAQAQYRQLLNDALLIEPAAFIRSTGGLTTAQLQGTVGFILGAESDIIVKGGLGYRAPHTVYPLVGFEWRDLKVAAAYDIFAGGLQGAIDGVGDEDVLTPPTERRFLNGFEIAAQYIIKIYKQPKVDAVILCPQI